MHNKLHVDEIGVGVGFKQKQMVLFGNRTYLCEKTLRKSHDFRSETNQTTGVAPSKSVL